MQAEELKNLLRKYEAEIDGIIGRFVKYRGGIHIHENDSSRFEQLIIELRDLYNDSLSEKSYSSMTIAAFNEGIGNYTRSPSLKSVERVKGIVNSAITRIERNPEIIKSKNNKSPSIEKSPLSIPEKVTLHWLYKNVSAASWVAAIGILCAAFSLGVAATAKLTFVQEWFGIKVENPAAEDQEVKSR